MRSRTACAQSISVTLECAAYLRRDWDGLADVSCESTLLSLLPANFPFPLVAPTELGRAALRGSNGCHPLTSMLPLPPSQSITAKVVQPDGRTWSDAGMTGQTVEKVDGPDDA